MVREDIIRMARDAGWSGLYITYNEPTGKADWKMVKESLTVPVTMEQIERFAALVAIAEREILADWMRQHGFSTGQAYTTEILLDRLGTETVENTDAAVLEEREKCAKVCEAMRPSKPEFDQRYYQGCTDSAAAIRARINT